MTGDPKVLAGLQQAYLAEPQAHEFFLMHIRNAWRTAAERPCVPSHLIDAEIRAWTPPPAEPSLEQRVAEIERGYRHHDQQIGICLDGNSDLTNRINDEEAVNRRQWDEINDLRSHVANLSVRVNTITHPEPPAPDLDPVRVEAAAKTLRRSATRWEDVPLADQQIWIRDAETAIRAYLKDGGA